jgi:hypothetical protein
MDAAHKPTDMEDLASEVCDSLLQQIYQSLEGTPIPYPPNVAPVVKSATNMVSLLRQIIQNADRNNNNYFWYAIEDSVSAHINVLKEYRVRNNMLYTRSIVCNFK